MKKFLISTLILLFVITLTGCSLESEADKFREDYESLNGEKTDDGNKYREISIDYNNPIKYSSFKEVKEKINNKDTFIVYVGFSACPWCRSVLPYVLESAKENKIDEIYYINVREDNTKESDLRGYFKLDENNNVVVDIYPDKYYHHVLNTLNDFLEPFTIENEQGEVFETGENRLYAPTIIVYKKGKAIALDECISDKQNDPYQELTKDMQKEMKEKANKLFKEYKK